MSFILIKINDELFSENLETTAKLSEVRKNNSIFRKSDKFLKSGGKLSHKSEATVTVADVIQEDKEKKKFIAVFREEKKTTNLPQRAIKEAKTKDIVIDDKKREDEITIALAKAAKTTSFTNYFDLSPEEKEKVIANNQLGRGIVPTLEAFEKSMFSPIVGNTLEFIPVIVEGSLIQKTFSTYSRKMHASYKATGHAASASISASVVSVQGAYSKNESSKKIKDKEILHITASTIVPKIRFKLNRSKIKVAPDYIQAMTQAVTQGYQAVLDCLEDYGFFIPTDIVLGGKLSTEDSKEKTAVTNEKEEETSLSVALSAKIYGVDIGGGYSQKSKEGSKDINVNQQRAIAISAVGGDPAASFDQAAFIASLGDRSTWRTIIYNHMIPTINLLPSNVASQIATLLRNNSKAIGGINVAEYVGKIESDIADDLD